MTLEEAIKHCNEKASESTSCDCCQEHKQLANWLTELKYYKDGKHIKKDNKLVYYGLTVLVWAMVLFVGAWMALFFGVLWEAFKWWTILYWIIGATTFSVVLGIIDIISARFNKRKCKIEH